MHGRGALTCAQLATTLLARVLSHQAASNYVSYDPSGQTYSQRLLVNDWYKFSGAGQYSIKAVLGVTVKAQSELMPLTVEPPAPMEDM